MYATICNSAAWPLQFLQKPAANLDAQALSPLQWPSHVAMLLGKQRLQQLCSLSARRISQSRVRKICASSGWSAGSTSRYHEDLQPQCFGQWPHSRMEVACSTIGIEVEHQRFFQGCQIAASHVEDAHRHTWRQQYSMRWHQAKFFNRSVIAGSKDFTNLMGNWVLLAMITCGKIALKPKSVDTDAKSVIRDLWVLKDACTAPRTDRKTVPRHLSTCIAKEHSWPKYFLVGCSWPTGKKNRPGLQAPKQKLLQKQAPKKGCQKWTLKKGPPYLSEP